SKPPCAACSRIGARTKHESNHPGRWPGHPDFRRNAYAPQADDRDRRPPDPVAHHEDLLRPRRERVRDSSRLQGLHDQGVFRQLLPAHVRRHLRHGRQPHGSPPAQGRTMARDAGRHRREHHDRRPPQARGRLRQGRRGVSLHLRRRRGGHRHQRPDRVPPPSWR
ncbi:hypothetical protein OY671_010031, partial [Metschnikowia pulcherrima]